MRCCTFPLKRRLIFCWILLHTLRDRSRGNHAYKLYRKCISYAFDCRKADHDKIKSANLKNKIELNCQCKLRLYNYPACIASKILCHKTVITRNSFHSIEHQYENVYVLLCLFKKHLNTTNYWLMLIKINSD